MAIQVHKFEQTTAAVEWNIQHNLDQDLVCIDCWVVIDGALQKLLPVQILLVDNNNAKVTFSSARAGWATVA